MIINNETIRGIYQGFNSIFNEAFQGLEPNYQKIAMEVPSSSREENYAWLGEMPSMRKWVGARLIKNLMAHSYTIKNEHFELTISVNGDDVADDKIGVYKPIIQDMAENAKRHPDELVFPLLGNGFMEKCYDGKPFFAVDHPTCEGKNKTSSNRGTKKLNAVSYASARSQMMLIKGDNGKSIGSSPDLLVVAPQNEEAARKILYAEIIEGSTNINKGTCDLLVVPELAEFPEQWYLLCTKRAIKPLIFQLREKPRFVSKDKKEDDNVFMQNEYLYGVDARYNAGYGLWQLAFGSTGTEA